MKDKIVKWLIRLLGRKIYSTNGIKVAIPDGSAITSVSLCVHDTFQTVYVHSASFSGDCVSYMYSNFDDAMSDFLFANSHIKGVSK